MLNKILPLALLIIISFPTFVLANGVTETQSFILSVTLPRMITIPQETEQASTGISTIQQQNLPLVQEQQLVRNNQLITFRSVVVL